jgi:hypothetical protein
MAAIAIPLDGQRYLGDNPQVQKIARCRLAFSGGDVDTGAVQATYALFNVPAGLVVVEMFAITSTAWTASVTITIGDGASAAGFFASADLGPTTGVTTGILKRSSGAAEAYAGGKRYEAADTIDAVVGGANPDAGVTDVYLVYIEDYTQL